MMKNKILATLAATLAALAAQAQAPALSTFAVGPTTVTVSALTPNLDTVWELLWGPDNFGCLTILMERPEWP